MGRGLSKPSWMSNEQFSEYKMTAEAKDELSGFDYSQFDEPEDDR
jgi:hypothetical protein